MSFDSYYNEMYLADGSVRGHYQPLAEWLAGTPPERIAQMRQAAHLLFHRVGITFAVYGEEAGAERLIPFDIVPHIIPAAEWRDLAKRACASACSALNAFLHDIYHDQEILKAGKIPTEQVLDNSAVPAGDGRASTCPAASMRTSPASTSCARARASTTCSKTTCARRRACPTCWRTAR